MTDLIQRLRLAGAINRSTLGYEAADALEKLQNEATAWEVTVDNLKAEIERLNGYIQKANMDVTEALVERDALKEGMKFLSMHVDVLLGNNAELKAQAAKDAADAGRWRMLASMEAGMVAPDTLRHYIAFPAKLDYAIKLKAHHDAAMKESQPVARVTTATAEDEDPWLSGDDMMGSSS